MDIRPITETYSVAPQLMPDDLPEIAEAGYRVLVCNRPDMEVPAELQAEVLRHAAEAAGLVFVDNPVQGAAMTMDNVEAQAGAISGAPGPVLAYCASGTRSAAMWAFAMAGQISTDDILTAAANAGYPFWQLRGQLDALSGG